MRDYPIHNDSAGRRDYPIHNDSAGRRDYPIHNNSVHSRKIVWAPPTHAPALNSTPTTTAVQPVVQAAKPKVSPKAIDAVASTATVVVIQANGTRDGQVRENNLLLQASRETTVAVAPCPCDLEEETAAVPFVAEEETTTNEEVEKEAVEVMTPDSTTKDLPVEEHYITETDPQENTVKAVDLQKPTVSLAEKQRLAKAFRNTTKLAEAFYKTRDGLELGVTRLADESILLQETTQEPLLGMYVSYSSQISQVSTQTQDAFPKVDNVDSLQDNSVPSAVGKDPSALQMDANLEDKEVTGKKIRGPPQQL
eukprot:scaffold16159_cov43-Attheya_sp.AAC.3